MITDLVVTAILGAISALVGLIPSWTLPGMDSTNGHVVGQYLYYTNTIVPMFTIVGILAASIALRGILAGGDLIIWIYHQFWGGD